MAATKVTGSKSELLQTALAAVDGYNKWDIDAILAPRADSCTQEILPKSLGRPLLNNKDYRAYFEPLLPAFKNFTVTILDVIEDSENHKVVIHASSTADSVVGPYKNEYMLVFHMTEDDKQIVHLKEFVDSVVSMSLIKQIKEHVAQQGAQN
jgi:ketosteroid isomerase-like protein